MLFQFQMLIMVLYLEDGDIPILTDGLLSTSISNDLSSFDDDNFSGFDAYKYNAGHWIEIIPSPTTSLNDMRIGAVSINNIILPNFNVVVSGDNTTYLNAIGQIAEAGESIEGGYSDTIHPSDIGLSELIGFYDDANDDDDNVAIFTEATKGYNGSIDNYSHFVKAFVLFHKTSKSYIVSTQLVHHWGNSFGQSGHISVWSNVNSRLSLSEIKTDYIIDVKDPLSKNFYANVKGRINTFDDHPTLIAGWGDIGTWDDLLSFLNGLTIPEDLIAQFDNFVDAIENAINTSESDEAIENFKTLVAEGLFSTSTPEFITNPIDIIYDLVRGEIGHENINYDKQENLIKETY